MTLNLNFKGDLKRESRWFAQYGQAACTLIVAAILWQLDRPRRADGHHAALTLIAAVFGTSVISVLVKRLLGRVRPGRENAGRFLGPTWRHANFRESFPSSHSACAVAMTVVLAHLYAPAAPVFWAMAIITAVLRYLMDAHWPSDVVSGMALGYVFGAHDVEAGILTCPLSPTSSNGQSNRPSGSCDSSRPSMGLPSTTRFGARYTI